MNLTVSHQTTSDGFNSLQGISDIPCNFSFNQNKKNGSLANYLSTSPYEELGDIIL